VDDAGRTNLLYEVEQIPAASNVHVMVDVCWHRAPDSLHVLSYIPVGAKEPTPLIVVDAMDFEARRIELTAYRRSNQPGRTRNQNRFRSPRRLQATIV
jgi:hypothetical protein